MALNDFWDAVSTVTNNDIDSVPAWFHSVDKNPITKFPSVNERNISQYNRMSPLISNLNKNKFDRSNLLSMKFNTRIGPPLSMPEKRTSNKHL